jgi:hypothetical protein
VERIGVRLKRGVWSGALLVLAAACGRDGFRFMGGDTEVACGAACAPGDSWYGLGGSDFVPWSTYTSEGSASGGGVSGSLELASTNPSVARDGNGYLVVVWEETLPAGGWAIYGRRFDGRRWSSIGAGSDAGTGISGEVDGGNPALAIDSAGSSVVVWSNPTGTQHLYAKRFDGTLWQELGSGSASGGGITPASTWAAGAAVAVDGNGDIIVAWHDTGLGGLTDIFAMRYDGTGWAAIGTGSASGGGVSNNSGSSSSPRLAVDGAGRPVLAWDDNSDTSGTWNVYVRRFDGTSWQPLGVGSASGTGVSVCASGVCGAAAVTSTNDGVLVAWQNAGGDIHLVRWNESSWTELGTGSSSGAGVSINGGASSPLLAADSSGRTVIAWQRAPDLYVRFFDGSAWQSMGGAPPQPGVSGSPNTAELSAFALDRDDSPVIVWGEQVGSAYETYARRFDGTSWVELGNAVDRGGVSDSATASLRSTLVVRDDGRPIVVWEETVGGVPAIYARELDGTSWIELGTDSASGRGVSQTAGPSESPALALDPSGSPVVAWFDASTGSRRVYLRRFDGNVWQEVSGSASGLAIGAAAQGAVVSIATDSLGRIAVAWDGDDGSDLETYARLHDGTGWTDLGPSSSSGGGVSNNSASSHEPSIIFDSNDDIVLAWQDLSTGVYAVHAVRFIGGAWQPIGTGSAAGTGISASPVSCTNVTLAAGSGGAVHASWLDHGGTLDVGLARWNGGTWEYATPQPSGTSGRAPAMTLDRLGRPTVTWSRLLGGQDEIVVVRREGDTWVDLTAADPRSVSNSGAPSTDPAIASGGSRLCVAWSEGTASQEIVLRCTDQ